MIQKLKSLGPGLLYAGAAIGVSHIVQSTRAGANYGFILIIAIVLAHLLKYPFFVLGPRYANQAGETLIQGYKKIGNWALIVVCLLTFFTMFSVQAAVTVVTAGLAEKLTGIVLSPWIWSAILLAICLAILAIGKFNVLDNLMKVIMIVLALSTILAFFFSFGIDIQTQADFKTIFSFSNPSHVDDLIAFVGWMPAPIEIAIWHSIWTVTKNKNENIDARNSGDFDFNVGFYGTAFLAICFLTLGANLLYGTGIPLETKAGAYAAQLVDLYTQSLGNWSYFLILIAAFTTMFSTTLTCFDAMPRLMKAVVDEWTPTPAKANNRITWMLILAIGAIIILAFFITNMGQMVHLATVVSFLTAPILAIISYILVKKRKDLRNLWSNSERKLALIGIAFLLAFSLFYLYTLV
ncbi:divalent metal cation transporter [bacterium]|nr:divalent metal cation transporter [bacterium]